MLNNYGYLRGFLCAIVGAMAFAAGNVFSHEYVGSFNQVLSNALQEQQERERELAAQNMMILRQSLNNLSPRLVEHDNRVKQMGLRLESLEQLQQYTHKKIKKLMLQRMAGKIEDTKIQNLLDQRKKDLEIAWESLEKHRQVADEYSGFLDELKQLNHDNLHFIAQIENRMQDPVELVRVGNQEIQTIIGRVRSIHDIVERSQQICQEGLNEVDSHMQSLTSYKSTIENLDISNVKNWHTARVWSARIDHCYHALGGALLLGSAVILLEDHFAGHIGTN